MSPQITTRKTRRAYTRSEYRYVAQHYRSSTAPALAAALGRTLGSFKHFLHDHPELRKRFSA